MASCHFDPTDRQGGIRMHQSFVLLAMLGAAPAPEESSDVRLPAGVQAVWDLAKAHRERTTTRERVCLNGLWRWQPAEANTDVVPKGGWGYCKVPAFWPLNTSYIQEDCQAVHVHPSWKGTDLRGITAAWYQREITVPADWTNRRIVVAAEYVNSFAVVYVDGDKAGAIRFPAGEVDVTAKCRPGGNHAISFHVHALPLKVVLLSHTDTNSVRGEGQGRPARPVRRRLPDEHPRRRADHRRQDRHLRPQGRDHGQRRGRPA